jgi:hypothetical protein
MVTSRADIVCRKANGLPVPPSANCTDTDVNERARPLRIQIGAELKSRTLDKTACSNLSVPVIVEEADDRKRLTQRIPNRSSVSTGD